MSTHHHLSAYLADLPVASAHEHHREDAWHADLDLTKLVTNSYAGWANLVGWPIEDRERFLDLIPHNSFFVWLERAIQHIYGVDRITAENWDDISIMIGNAHGEQPDWHVEMMRRFGHYRRAVEDAYWNPGATVGHPSMFAAALRINAFVMCHHPEMTDHNGNSPWKTFGIQAETFGDYLENVEAVIATHKANGAVALKNALAYDRDLAFAPAGRAQAQAAYGKHLSEVAPETRRAYENFMFDYLCGLAAKYELPLQNHTGLGQIDGSNPMKLEPMIARHPETKFVMFHGGYPWVGEIGGLAVTYRNIYPDLTWLPLISTTAAIRAVREWTETAWSSRFICWGGDAWTGEESVGAALALKHVLKVALGQLVDEGYFDIEEAEVVARRICYENAERLYGLCTTA